MCGINAAQVLVVEMQRRLCARACVLYSTMGVFANK